MRNTRTVREYGDGYVTLKKVDRRTGRVISTQRLLTDRKAESRESGLVVAPAVRTNAIPGESARVTHDPMTGQDFTTRSDYENYLKQNGLVETTKKEMPFASEPAKRKRNDMAGPKTYIQGRNGMTVVPSQVGRAWMESLRGERISGPAESDT